MQCWSFRSVSPATITVARVERFPIFKKLDFTITSRISGILTEDVDLVFSLESGLYFLICFVRTLDIFEVLPKKKRAFQKSLNAQP